MDASPDPAAVDQRYYEVATPNSLAERVVVRARNRIFADFMRIAAPAPHDTILDVGISDVVGDAANVLERLYPHPSRITAVGLGSAEAFQAAFPQIAYRRIVPHEPLPFADRHFAIATANAVLEHVGSAERQRQFVAELCRVAARVVVTVPNRFFPVEHHTGIPLLHWTDASFAWACGRFGKAKWAEPENLILMSRRRLAATCPPGRTMRIGRTGITLGPCSGNLYGYIGAGEERRRASP